MTQPVPVDSFYIRRLGGKAAALKSAPVSVKAVAPASFYTA
jgi:hypothetical protein